MPSSPETDTLLYYSYRKVSSEKIQQLMALENFVFQITEAVEHYKEAAVTAQKLQWWEAEINRLYSNQPTHPLSKQLMPLIDNDFLSGEILNHFLHQNQQLLFGQQFETPDALYQFIDETYLPLELSKATCLLLPARIDDQHKEIITHLTRANEVIRRIDQLPHHIQREIFSFPIATDTKTPPTQQYAEKHLLEICQQLETLATQSYQQAYQIINPIIARELRPFLIKNKLFMKILKKMQKKQFPVLRQSIRLSPLSMALLSLISF